MTTKFLLLVIIFFGVFMRIYQYQERFGYAHDHDLASWIVKDIVIDRHLRLVGQETSSPGIFIGPLYYYSLIPFYLLTNMDPIGTIAFPWLIGLASIVSLYWVFNRLYNSHMALIGALIYSSSFLLVITDREVYPTTPVMLWTIWMFYAVNLLFKGDRRGLLLSAVLFSLVWHLNLALILIAPLSLLAVLWHRRQYTIKDLFIPVLAFCLLSLPLILFETRHGFMQTRALIGTFGSARPVQSDYLEKLIHVFVYTARNANRIFYFGLENKIPLFIVPLILLASFVYVIHFQKIAKFNLVLIFLWTFSFVAFFTFHPINLSEYYLNGINIIWLYIAALIVSRFSNRIVILVMIIFTLSNLLLLLKQNFNHYGYNEKKALVEYIVSDAKVHNYPCVSVSYMTDPGYELGYRYWFWLYKLHVNQPSSNSPVYTIVFPHLRANKLDATFGSLGLVLPDYSRYTSDQVKISCSGEDSNLTDPMFGFTK